MLTTRISGFPFGQQIFTMDWRAREFYLWHYADKCRFDRLYITSRLGWSNLKGCGVLSEELEISLSCERMGDDWFRNETWNEDIERRFNEKLRRARDKNQYLRIQALTLARSHPEVALRLLDQYFLLKDDFDLALARVVRAKALVALDRLSEAIEAYEAAMAREVELPNLRTQAYVELPYLIATRGLRERFPYALQLLEKHVDRLFFPIDHFRWHAALCLIAADSHDALSARKHARIALDLADLQDSGIRYHPSVGLVTKDYEALVQTLTRFALPE